MEKAGDLLPESPNRTTEYVSLFTLSGTVKDTLPSVYLKPVASGWSTSQYDQLKVESDTKR